MRTLQEVRKEIDEIDTALLELFRRRMAVMGEVAQAKRAAGIPLTDPVREQLVLDKVAAACPGLEDEARTLYAAIFAISKERQSKLCASEK